MACFNVNSALSYCVLPGTSHSKLKRDQVIARAIKVHCGTERAEQLYWSTQEPGLNGVVKKDVQGLGKEQ